MAFVHKNILLICICNRTTCCPAKLDEAVGRVLFCCQRNFSNPIISKLDKHVVLLLINYTVTKISLQIILLRGAALTTDHSLKIFNHVFVLSFNAFLFTFLPFKFFFLKHRKASALVILVIVAEVQRNICQFLRKLWRFLKIYSTARAMRMPL